MEDEEDEGEKRNNLKKKKKEERGEDEGERGDESEEGKGRMVVAVLPLCSALHRTTLSALSTLSVC